MTARKPPGVGWESWIDKQIREAEERGEFEDLPGAGQPIPDLDKPFDELWWVKNKLAARRPVLYAAVGCAPQPIPQWCGQNAAPEQNPTLARAGGFPPWSTAYLCVCGMSR